MATKTFTAGSILTASDTNTYLANASLVYVTSQVVGAGVSSVTVTGAFNSTYDNYRITYTGGSASALCLFYCYMGASTGTGYYGTRLSATVAGVANSTGDNNAAQWTYVNAVNTTETTTNIDLFSPQLAKRTYITSDYWEANAGSTTAGRYVGYLNNSTQYTSFTLQAQSPQTLTGGTITVYGYRKA